MSKDFHWPRVKTALTADPAAGVQIPDVVVPAGKRWLFYGAHCTLVAAVVAVSRYPSLIIMIDGVNYAFVASNTLTVTSGQTKLQSYKAMSLLTAALTQYGCHLPLLELPAAAIIRHTVGGLDGADNLTPLTYYYSEVPA